MYQKYSPKNSIYCKRQVCQTSTVEPTNCLSVFSHFVGLVLKGLKELKNVHQKIVYIVNHVVKHLRWSVFAKIKTAFSHFKIFKHRLDLSTDKFLIFQSKSVGLSEIKIWMGGHSIITSHQNCLFWPTYPPPSRFVAFFHENPLPIRHAQRKHPLFSQ